MVCMAQQSRMLVASEKDGDATAGCDTVPLHRLDSMSGHLTASTTVR